MHDELLASIEAFLLLHGMTARAFGEGALNDTALVSNLREGRELRRDTERRVRAFMEAKDRERSGAARAGAESGMVGDDD